MGTRIMQGIVAGRVIEAATELRGLVRGDVFVEGDREYDAARALWNGAIDRRPALVARVRSSADISAAIAVARRHELPLSVRGGGHGIGGHAIAENGLVIDMSSMKAIAVDPERRTARVEAGAILDDVNRATQPFSLAMTGGKNASPGVAGVVLGGGAGWLVRKHGLAIDSLLAAELITASGEHVRATAIEHPDLFWAIRGGAGNFGVATSFEFRLHQGGSVYGGALAYPFAKAREVLRFYAGFAAQAPDELTTIALLQTGPTGLKALLIAGVYSGDPEAGERAMAPLRAVSPPVMDMLQVLPFDELPRIVDSMIPAGIQRQWRSGLLRTLAEPLIDTLVAQFEDVPSPQTNILIEQLGGAIGRVDPLATAFSHRDAQFSVMVDGGWQQRDDTPRNVEWIRRVWRTIQPATHGVYVNFLDEEGPSRVRQAYVPEAFERLRAVKRVYDPENLFRSNQNIPPA